MLKRIWVNLCLDFFQLVQKQHTVGTAILAQESEGIPEGWVISIA